MTQQFYASLPRGIEGVAHYALLFDALRMFPNLAQVFFGSYAGIVAKMHEIVERGKRAGELRSDVDAEALAFAISAMIEGASLIVAMDQSIDLEQKMEALFHITWKGIAA